MNIPSYVHQNGFGVYYFRIAIPKHLKPVLRKHEIRSSEYRRGRSEKGPDA